MADTYSICRNCEAPLVGPYCHECGQAEAKRITWTSFGHRFWDRYLDLDHGIPHTIWSLIRRPGYTIREYIEGRRASYTDPVKLLLLAVSITTIILVQTDIMSSYMNGFQDGYMGSKPDAGREEAKEVQSELSQAMLEYMQVWLLFVVPFYTLFSWLFFKKQIYNKAETFIMVCFVSAMQNLAGIPFYLLAYFTGTGMSGTFFIGSAVASIGYTLYAMMDFYQAYSFVGFLKALVSYVVSFVTYLISFMVIAGVIVAVLMIQGKIKVPKKKKAETEQVQDSTTNKSAKGKAAKKAKAALFGAGILSE